MARKNLIDKDLIRGELSRTSLKHFVKTFWQEIEYNEFKDSWYIDAILEHLTHIHDVKRLLINVPARHGKSLICSVLFPAYLWLHEPEQKILKVGYSLNLATFHQGMFRRLISSPLYQKCFGSLYRLNDDQNTKKRVENNKTGWSMATSPDSGITGFGGSAIYDDPNNSSKVQYDYERKMVQDFYTQTLATRTNNPETDFRIVIQSRLHADDLSGYLLEHEKDLWCNLVLPFEYKKPATVAVPNSIGFSDPRTTEGDYLSDRLGKEADVNYLKRSMRAGWHVQYNQDASFVQDEGAFFRREWFRYYQENESNYLLDHLIYPKSSCWQMMSIDLAMTSHNTSDYTVMQVWTITPQYHMLLRHQIRDRMKNYYLMPTMKHLYDTFNCQYVLIEESPGYHPIANQARAENVIVRPFKTKGVEKSVRAIPLQIRVEAGFVYFPGDKDFMVELEHELTHFPDVPNDDQTDCASQVANELSRYKPTNNKPQDKPKQDLTYPKWMADKREFSVEELNQQALARFLKS